MFQKRLMQKRNATCIECLPMQDLIIKAGHENYRKLGPAGLQMMPQLNARRASKLNVQQKTIDPRNDNSHDELWEKFHRSRLWQLVS